MMFSIILQIAFFIGLICGIIAGLILFYTIFYEDMKAVEDFNKRQDHYRKWL